MKVLFLDIDGVLNNAEQLNRVKRYDVFDPTSVNELNRVLLATGAQIVISSTWRYANTIEMLNGRFTLAGIVPDRIVDFTPKTLNYGRGQEIALWLAAHEDVRVWAVVDDDHDMDPLKPERVVLTSWLDGLQARHADRLIEILGKA